MSFPRLLIIGGTGSLGQRLVDRHLEPGGSEIFVFSRDEAKQYEMQTDPKYAQVKFILGDIRKAGDIATAFDIAKPVDVINAAALKQVPACEDFPEQAVATNIIGMQNLIDTIAGATCVKTCVMISTDKACEPTTVMGMTKAIQERMMVAASKRYPETRFLGVRYGNVMGSRGSVIPLFQQQIARDGSVTITDRGMTRFMLTLDGAVDIVMYALEQGVSGEIFIPRAPSSLIEDVAIVLGAKVLRTIGRRPGEKLHEVMFSKDEKVYSFGGRFVLPPPGRWDPGVRAVGEYSSKDDVLSAMATRALLQNAGFIK